jgi:hypothetical protein
VNLLFLILQFLKLEILLLICTSFGGAYKLNQWHRGDNLIFGSDTSLLLPFSVE